MTVGSQNAYLAKFLTPIVYWRAVEELLTLLRKTRTKTSIRYAKENDGEKRERKTGRKRDIEREGEIREREREVKGIEVKGIE